MVLFVLVSTSSCKVGSQVILNVWDAADYAVMKRLYDEGKLPNLQKIGGLKHLTCNENNFGLIISECPRRHMLTQTKPQHATMLTGVLVDQHGVMSNLDGCYQQVPVNLTVFKKVKDIKPNAFTAYIASKPDQIGDMVFGSIIPIVDDYYVEDVVQSTITYKTKNLITQWKDSDFFIFAHYKDPDATGHVSGGDIIEYENAIIEDDNNLGRIISHLKELGIYNNVKIYVLSDHGFGCPDNISHRCSPNAFIVSTDTSVPSGLFMKDVAGYILKNY